MVKQATLFDAPSEPEKPIVIDLDRKLVMRNLELAMLQVPPISSGEVPDAYKKGHTEINLSRLRWVEPYATLRLVLIIEALLLGGARQVVIHMPSRDSTDEEKRIFAEANETQGPEARENARIARRVLYWRRRAAATLDQLGFRAALRHSHLAGLPLLFSDEQPGEPQQAEVTSRKGYPTMDPDLPPEPQDEEPSYFQYVCPLTWIPDPREKGRAHLEKIGKLLTPISHSRLWAFDGPELKDVLLKELAENTVDHSHRQWSLITAWNRPVTHAYQEDEILKCELPWVDTWKQQHVRADVDIPLLEMVVGDSGIGIPASLGPIWAVRQNPDHVPTRKDHNRILEWAFDRYSSKFEPVTKSATRGLHRVKEVVRRHNGCVTLRSESSLVGHNGLGEEEVYFRASDDENALAHVPGTVAHIRIPMFRLQAIEERPGPLNPEEFEFKTLDYAHDDWWKKPLTAIPNDVRKEIAGLGANACVIVDIGYRMLDRKTLEQLSIALCKIAAPQALVLANIGEPGWTACETVINSVAESMEPGAPMPAFAEGEVYAPIILRHADGSAGFVGTKKGFGKLFQTLLDTGVLNLSAIKVSQRKQLVAIARLCPFIQVGETSLRLRFNRADIGVRVSEPVAKQLERRFREAAESEMKPNLAFRTPSLSLVKSFVNCRSLLESFGVERATGALADEVLAKWTELASEDVIEVVTHAAVSWELVDAFCVNLRSRLRTKGSLAQVHMSPLGSNDKLPVENCMTIVLADIVYSSHTIQRLLDQTERARSAETRIATVFDARGEEPGELRYDVVALCRVLVEKAEITPDLKIINVSPETLDPRDEPDPIRLKPPISDAKLQEMLSSKPQALFFGHVYQPRGRHFCYYLDPRRFVSENRIEQVVQFLKQEIDDTLGEGVVLDAICYPITEGPPVAKSLAEELTRLPEYSHLRPVPVGIEGAGRAALGDPKTVVVVDSGSLSGRSVRDLLRVVAEVGAIRVLVVVVFSHLTAEEELFLRRLRSYALPDRFGKGEVQVTVRFLARFPMRAYEPENCPYCMQIQRFSDELANCRWQVLNDFGKTATKRMKPVSVESAGLRIPRYSSDELQTRFLEETDILPIARLRTVLDQAQYRTTARQALLDEMNSLSGATPGTSQWQDRRLLVALTAAEWTLMKKEPFFFRKFREKLAALADEVVRDPASSKGDRRDGIAVLRMASKHVFANAFHELFHLLKDDLDLVTQLLFGVYTITLRKYRMDDVDRALRGGLSRVWEEIGQPDVRPTIDPLVYYTVGRIYHTVLTDLKASTDIDRWQKLADLYVQPDRSHHLPYSEALDYTLPRGVHMERILDENWKFNLADLHDIDGWATCLENWAVCRDFIIQIEPLLRHLRPVLAGPGMDTIGIDHKDRAALIEFIDDKWTDYSAFVSDVLQRLAAKAPIDEIEWRKFLRYRTLLGHLLIRGTPPKLTINGDYRSVLARMLKGLPANAPEVVRKVKEDYDPWLDITINNQLLRSTDGYVFCHETILDALMRQLFANVIDHNDPEQKDCNIEVVVDLTVNDGRLELTVRNKGRLSDRESKGTGLESRRERLAPYGAKLEPIKPVPPGWTYAITASLEIWGGSRD